MTIKETVVDFNPKLWLKPLQKTSVLDLIKIALFYHALGLVAMYSVSAAITAAFPHYEIPSIPVSLSLAVSSGAAEEALFFGIPFYITNHPLIVFGTGIMWSFVHLFNTQNFAFSNLAYGSLFFTIPHIFFSLRTWISGKGWFAVAFHSMWNLAVLSGYCISGFRQCYLFGVGDDLLLDIFSISAAISSIVLVYMLYKMTKDKIQKQNPLVWLPITGLVVSQVFLSYLSVERITTAVAKMTLFLVSL